MAARLYVVATPIGNLADMTQRATDILRSVPVVACEDTRRSRPLLAHVGASPSLVALHEHNETEASAAVLQRLLAGDDVALVSDAGTPLFSDPGFELVRLAWQHGVAVVPVPGANAVAAAVAVSPIPMRRFHFEGFLPARSTARRTVLRQLLAASVPVVFFEAPHRIRQTLADLLDLGGGERRLLLCRELTKRFEEVLFATTRELLQAEVPERGEYVCVLEAAGKARSPAQAERVLKALTAELPAAQAARLAARITGRPRSELYEIAMSWRDDDGA